MQPQTIQRLHAAVADVAPIEGVSIGSPDDRGSWRIDFMPAATAEQRAAAAAVLTGFDPDAPQPPPLPEEISDRQFFQGLAVRGLISEDEALAAVSSGAIPAAMQAFIDQLPVAQRFSARMMLSGAVTFARSHPLTAAFGAMQGMTDAQIDDLWRFCATL